MQYILYYNICNIYYITIYVISMITYTIFITCNLNFYLQLQFQYLCFLFKDVMYMQAAKIL